MATIGKIRKGSAAGSTIGLTQQIERLGKHVIDMVAELGSFVEFTLTTFYWMFRRRPCQGTLLPSMYQVGVKSVPVVAVTGAFIGMVLANQGYNTFRMMRMESRLGSVINVSLVKELGPVLAATMLAGRIGSSMAAEIGTMKVTEQIDALRCLAVHPIHYLVVPRFLACVLLIPLLTVMADFTGIIGGALVSIHILHVDSFHYWKFSRSFVGVFEVMSGLFKSFFFGAQIALLSCYRGFRSGAGAEGVGRAATEAFVISFIAILATDFFLGVILNGVYYSLWPNQGSGAFGPGR